MNTTNPLIELEELKKIEEETKLKETIEEVSTKKELPPTNYIRIALDSNGKLSLPKAIHVRDYSLNEALALDVYEEKDQIRAVVNIFNEMTFEDIDFRKAHLKELMTVLLSLHGNFISTKVEKEYLVNEDLPEGYDEGEKYHKGNLAVQEIPIKNIKVKNIDKDINDKKLTATFKSEPFKIRDKKAGVYVWLRLVRVGDMIDAYDFCDTHFHEELREFSTVRRELRELGRIKDLQKKKEAFWAYEHENYDTWKNYESFMQKYEQLYLKVLQAKVIIKYNEEDISNSVEKQLQALKQIPYQLWTHYDEIAKIYDFGIQSDVTFNSEVLGKPITRRFQFRPLDFLPDPKKPNSGRFDFSFD